MKKSWLVILIMLGSTVEAQESSPRQSPEPVQSEKQAEPWQGSPVQKQLHEIHCRERGLRGLLQQRLDRRLCDLAQRWAETMASRGSMYHSSLGISENVAYGYGSPESAISAWINSGGHYANLMSGYEDVGFGAAQDSGGTWYWCSLHGGEASLISDQQPHSYPDGRRRWRPFRGRLRLRG